MAVTQADLPLLKAMIDANDRAGFYLLYYNMTGSQEALLQAQISSFSGSIGGVALYANATVQGELSLVGKRSLYPPTVEVFSLEIATALYDDVAANVTNGGNGVIPRLPNISRREQHLDSEGPRGFFPGNPLSGKFTFSSVFADVVGIAIVSSVLDEGLPLIMDTVPPGGETITTPDGKATYIVDAEGHVVTGSVQINNVAPSIQFNSTTQGGAIKLNYNETGSSGSVTLAQTLTTGDVDGVTTVTGQTSTVTTPAQTIQFTDSVGASRQA